MMNLTNPVIRVTDCGAVPGSPALQTEQLQAAFDGCRTGGTVVIPRGTFRTGGLRMWSDTTLYLESGAVLSGSDVCEDYAVFPIPAGVSLRTDMELIPQYYNDRPWDTYRRAILTVLGRRNIRIIGEPGSRIDGSDCTDPQGEEGFRGPHGIFLTNVTGVTLEGYTIADCGNFMHQIDNCRDITMRNVTCTGGSDGVHLHHCVNTLIEDCVFLTGDDCIAGINMEYLTVRRCELNTSCDVFRVGGSHILVEDCRIFGPGIFPHRMTVVQNRGTEKVRDKSNTLPREMGRHNLITVWLHFASTTFPAAEPYHDVTFRRVTVENADRFLTYHADIPPLEAGAYLSDVTLEDVTCTGLMAPSETAVSAAVPLTVTLKNVTAVMRDGQPGSLFDGRDPHLTLING